ncbi:MAG: MtrAB system histidine kinase MtrB [Candidatus Nanopelagicaceae bacterium]|nr:MtrAB system histidine kinase MtrB [Candidatus Nanopelagicaceae bacterium]
MTRRIRVARFRNSLAFRVIFSTVLLCLGVVWLTGSALYAQLSDGIRKVTVESSVAETRSAIFNAQYRIVVASESKAQAIKQIVDDVIVNSPSVIGTSIIGREVALLRTGPASADTINYQRTSNGMLLSSIPEDLRKRVAKSISTEWAETSIRYTQGGTVPALAVGEKITIPGAGAYEMYLLFSLASQNATLDLLARSLLFTGLALVLLIALIAWLVVRQVVRPVREAARIAEGFTAGHLEQRMQVKGNDEIARLGNSFNEMALSLQNQISRLENLSSVQQRFVSDVSHELRTPLTTLRMASEVIHSARDEFDPTIARSAELLVAQIDRFERLLEDLLEVSRFDAEVAVLESVEFDMVALVTKCIDDLSLLAKERATSIDLRHADAQILVNADTRRVERILRNLLSNAIEYSNGTAISVRIVASENEVAVGVRDYGSGLDEQSTYRVFDRFWREDPSRARVRGGTGLGLSIALEDARLHNGELEAWGRPGKGAHFVLTLPRWTGGVVESRLIRLQPEDYSSTAS